MTYLNKQHFVYIQMLCILWSFYLLTIFLSTGDHIIIHFIFFICIFGVAYKLGDIFKIKRGHRFVSILFIFFAIKFGQIIFQIF
jgi:hypothetical protein